MKNFFIGILFIFLNFTLDFNGHTLGLIPNFIGYWFVLKAVEGFDGKVSAFEKIKQLSKIMIAVYIVVYALDLLAVNLGVLSIVLSIALLAANLYVSFYITEGVFQLEREYGFMEAEKLRSKWKLFAVMQCAVLVLMWVPLVNLVALVVNLVAAVMFLVAFNDVKNHGIHYGL